MTAERTHKVYTLSLCWPGKQVERAQGQWLVSPEVLNSTVVECSLQEAYNCTKVGKLLLHLCLHRCLYGLEDKLAALLLEYDIASSDQAPISYLGREA